MPFEQHRSTISVAVSEWPARAMTFASRVISSSMMAGSVKNAFRSLMSSGFCSRVEGDRSLRLVQIVRIPVVVQH